MFYHLILFSLPFFSFVDDDSNQWDMSSRQATKLSECTFSDYLDPFRNLQIYARNENNDGVNNLDLRKQYLTSSVRQFYDSLNSIQFWYGH